MVVQTSISFLGQYAFTFLLLAPLIYVFYSIVQILIKTRRIAKTIDRFPGDPTHWFWGNLHQYPGPHEGGLAFAREKVARHPQLTRVWIGPFMVHLNLQHADTVKLILKTSEPKPDGFTYGWLKEWLGDGLLISKGNKWARNRRLLTPAFHFDILKPYMQVYNTCVDVLLKKMSSYAKSGESIEMFSNISLCTLDILLRCAFSFDNDVQIEGEHHPYVQAVTELGDALINRFLKPWLHINFIWRLSSEGRRFYKNCAYVHKVAEEIIEKRKKTLAETGGEPSDIKSRRYLDFLDILLTAKDVDGKGLSVQEIRDEVDTFLFEGHDTTASAISWALHTLAEHPEIQLRCQEEVDEVVAGKDSPVIEWDDLPKLKYLNMCIKESMRLNCPVPFIQRQTTQEVEIDGITVPKGTILDVQIYNLHHNPQIWENSLEFKPDRFLPENVEKRDPYAYVPFSAGPRNCIGQNFATHEQKVLIAKVLQRFTLEIDPDRKARKKLGVVMKCEDGMYLKIRPR